MKNVLCLASKSKSRQSLLTQAGIPFCVIDNQIQEEDFYTDIELDLYAVVQNIALAKMENVLLSSGQENEIKFILTADSMGRNSDGQILGKPKNKEDAIRMLKSYRDGSETCTAFCLEKRIWKKDKWILENRILDYASAKYIFDVADDWVERYFELSIKAGISYLNVSGAVAIEEFGAQFLKELNGSYTAVVGLPMYGLRLALEKLKFFD